MDNLADWLNAVAATAAAIFSFLAWRSSTRAPVPEFVLTSATIVEQNDIEPYVEVHFHVRNLSEQTLYVRRLSFARTGKLVEVAQAYAYDALGDMAHPEDFQGSDAKIGSWAVARPSGSTRSATANGDTIWHVVRLRSGSSLPTRVQAEAWYSYGSPSAAELKLRTNEVPVTKRNP